MTIDLNLIDEYYNFYKFLNLTNLKKSQILNMFSETPSMCLNFSIICDCVLLQILIFHFDEIIMSSKKNLQTFFYEIN
jgi:hypothetical protein